MRIVFMGTPEFAVRSLQKLHQSSHHLVGVVTQPDRPKGRGRQLAASPVKQEAMHLGLPIFQPERLKDPEFLDWLKARNADCFIVVGFRILPPEVFEIPPKGTVNLHASLLPKYRGAAPIQWALINGEKKTGVSTFFIERKVDTGDLILQEGIPIGPDETAGQLHDRLAEVGADLLVKTADLVDQGPVRRIPQEGTPTPAPKILPENCQIDWTLPAERIVNLIRGLSPIPGAFTRWDEKRLKILRASSDKTSVSQLSKPGRVAVAAGGDIIVEAGTGSVRIHELQIEGKKRMEAKEFLRGRSLAVGTMFE
jgi:methionyl-tRNA formyltransferase